MFGGSLLPFLAALLAATFVVRWAARQLAIRRFMARTGSRPAPYLPGGFLGRRIITEEVAATKAGNVMQLHDRRLWDHHGTYQASVMGRTIWRTGDAVNMRHIATSMADWGVWRRAERGVWGPFLEKGIFTSDGHDWQFSRGLVRPAVTRAQVAQVGRLEPHVADLVARIPADGRTFEAAALLLDMTLDSAQEMLLGVGRADTLDTAQREEKARFQAAMDDCMEAIFWRVRMSALQRWLDWRGEMRYLADVRSVHGYVDRLIARHAEKLEREGRLGRQGHAAADAEKAGDRADDAGDGRGYVFADELLRVTGGDREQVRWEVLSVLVAGRDTTASLLAHLIYHLVRFPEVQAKLRAEVAGLDGRAPDYDTLKGMTYLKYVVQESEFL